MICFTPHHTHLYIWNTPSCYLYMYSWFKNSYSESNSLYSTRLLLVSHFLSHASILRPWVLMIPTIAAIQSCRTCCLINHVESISCHIIPLVINSLDGVHTQTHIPAFQTTAILRNQALASWSTLGLIMKFKKAVLESITRYATWLQLPLL